ncbi:KPN_01571 family protein [Escherichia coli]
MNPFIWVLIILMTLDAERSPHNFPKT